MERNGKSHWLKGIVAVGLGLTLLGFEVGGAFADQGTSKSPPGSLHGSAAPDACSINGALLGVPGTVVTDLLEQGGFVGCLDKATNKEALECVAERAALLAGGSDQIDPAGRPIWLVPKDKPVPWWCVPEITSCACIGNDDCVDLILFGPCIGGTMTCDDVGCSCTY